MALAKYNSSTLLASYDADTKKAQTVLSVPCGFCIGTPPATVQVVLAGLSDCGCTAVPEGSKLHLDQPDMNGAYSLPQIEGTECAWYYENIADYGRGREWDAYPCNTGNLITDIALTKFAIQVVKTSSTELDLKFAFEVFVVYSVGYDFNSYHYKSGIAVTSGCTDTAVTDVQVQCGYYNFLAGGTAQVSDL